MEITHRIVPTVIIVKLRILTTPLGLEGLERSSHQPTSWQRDPAAFWSQSQEGWEQGFGSGWQDVRGYQRYLISVLLQRGLVRADPSASFAYSSAALSLSHKVFLLSLLHPLVAQPSAYPNSEKELGRAAGREGVGGTEGVRPQSSSDTYEASASPFLWLSEAEGAWFSLLKTRQVCLSSKHIICTS